MKVAAIVASSLWVLLAGFGIAPTLINAVNTEYPSWGPFLFLSLTVALGVGGISYAGFILAREIMQHFTSKHSVN